MKRLSAVFALFIVFSFCVCGCKTAPQDGGDDAPENKISLISDSIRLEKFETYNLALIGAGDEAVAWASENEQVASVSDGLVSANGEGTTIVSATVGGKTLTCKVVVISNGYIPVITLGLGEGINLAEGQTFRLSPRLSYNGSEYTDAAYTYSSSSEAVAVDADGKITASSLGSGTVTVNGVWRGYETQTSLQVTVVDVSTVIEVSEREIELYLNSGYEEYPAATRLTVSVTDGGSAVADPVYTITEVPEEGDVSGVAELENGMLVAKKTGTAHYVAQYVAENGTVVQSAKFCVKSFISPAEIISTPIEGEDFEFFFKALDSSNSVEWDGEKQAFHLINTVKASEDARAFVFDTDYISNIMRYGIAESITFEFMADGTDNRDPADSGAEDKFVTDDLNVYTSFASYPSDNLGWWDDLNRTAHPISDNWVKMEIMLGDIPKDGLGNIKAPFIMNTIGGLYIRNVRVNLPVQYEVTATVDFTADNMSWVSGDATGLTGGNSLGTLTYSSDAELGGVLTFTDVAAYAVHELTLSQPFTGCADGMKLRLYLKAIPSAESVSNAELRFFNTAASGGVGDPSVPTVKKEIKERGEWTYIEMDLDPFLNDGVFNGIVWAAFGYNDWSSGERYTFMFDRIELLTPDR